MYVHKDYPKWITVDGRSFIVKDEAEHKSYLPKSEPVAVEPEPIDSDLQEIEAAELQEAPAMSREELLERAKAQGLKVDGRWSAARLQAAVNCSATQQVD